MRSHPLVAVWRAWGQALRALAADKGVMLLLVGAPLLYSVFYPWFYNTEAVTRVPVAVVDLDHSRLSRQITRFAQASPRIDVRWVAGNEHAAQQALWRGEIQGYAVLPADLQRSVARSSAAVVSVQANGAYALINKAVLSGFAEAVGTVSAGIEIRKLQASGLGATQAANARSPLQVQMVALFNPAEGYGSFVVPAVALLILQQTLLRRPAQRRVLLWLDLLAQRLPARRQPAGRPGAAGAVRAGRGRAGRAAGPVVWQPRTRAAGAAVHLAATGVHGRVFMAVRRFARRTAMGTLAIAQHGGRPGIAAVEPAGRAPGGGCAPAGGVGWHCHRRHGSAVAVGAARAAPGAAHRRHRYRTSGRCLEV